MAEKEYIEKGSLLKHFDDVINNKFGDADFKKAAWGFSIYVDNMPAADVAPVNHAKWAYGKLHGQSGYYCSECGAGFADINPNAELIAKSHDYCPKCGAKMDGG